MTSNVELPTILRDIAAGRRNTAGDFWSRDYCNQAAAEIEALRAEREVICAEAVKYADKSGRLEAKVDRLAEALRPFAELDLTPDDFDKRPDSQPIYARNKTAITVGDVRKARVALRRGRTDGGSEVRTEDEILALAAADGGGA